MAIPAMRIAAPEPGRSPSDEGLHPHAPGLASWSESFFWDFCDLEGQTGGHCRLSLHPVEERAWLWLLLQRGDEWVLIEEPRLPITALAARLFGLSFAWDPHEPLHAGVLRVEGVGRAGAGPRASRLLSLGAELALRGLGPLHSPPGSRVQGSDGAAYEATHYEQAAAYSGRVRIGDVDWRFDGFGHREHSWGPRGYRHEWDLLTLHAPDRHWRLSATAVAGAGRFETGTLQSDQLHAVSSLELDLQPCGDGLTSWSGSVSARAADGSELAGELEEISAAEIDHSHAPEVPAHSLLRRALVRLHPKRSLRRRKSAAAPPLVGWLETHRVLA